MAPLSSLTNREATGILRRQGRTALSEHEDGAVEWVTLETRVARLESAIDRTPETTNKGRSRTYAQMAWDRYVGISRALRNMGYDQARVVVAELEDVLLAAVRESKGRGRPASFSGTNGECQRCGKMGGGSIDYRRNGGVGSFWWCPWCDGIPALQKRLDEAQADAAEFAPCGCANLIMPGGSISTTHKKECCFRRLGEAEAEIALMRERHEVETATLRAAIKAAGERVQHSQVLRVEAEKSREFLLDRLKNAVSGIVFPP